jgi:hypothetical protein
MLFPWLQSMGQCGTYCEKQKKNSFPLELPFVKMRTSPTSMHLQRCGYVPSGEKCVYKTYGIR